MAITDSPARQTPTNTPWSNLILATWHRQRGLVAIQSDPILMRIVSLELSTTSTDLPPGKSRRLHTPETLIRPFTAKLISLCSLLELRHNLVRLVTMF